MPHPVETESFQIVVQSKPGTQGTQAKPGGLPGLWRTGWGAHRTEHQARERNKPEEGRWNF